MKKTLIYIASCPRSGSTILSNMLGNHPEVFNAGELLNMHSFLNNGRIGKYFEGACPCGSPVRDCNVWRPAIRKAMDCTQSMERDFITRMEVFPDKRLDKRILQRKQECEDLLSYVRNSEMAIRVGRHCFALLDALAEQQKVNTLVDSSKVADNLAIYLAHLPEDWEIRIIHVLRDPRATALSMVRGYERAGLKAPSFYRCMLGWGRTNDLIKKLSEKTEYLCLRLDSLCQYPIEELKRVQRILRIDLELSVLLRACKTRHDLAGSKSVAQSTGNIELKLDQKWKRNLNLLQAFIGGVYSKINY